MDFNSLIQKKRQRERGTIINVKEGAERKKERTD